jgi:hypothetical protein
MLYEMIRDYKCLFMFDKWFAMRKMTTLYVAVEVYTLYMSWFKSVNWKFF